MHQAIRAANVHPVEPCVIRCRVAVFCRLLSCLLARFRRIVWKFCAILDALRLLAKQTSAALRIGTVYRCVVYLCDLGCVEAPHCVHPDYLLPLGPEGGSLVDWGKSSMRPSVCCCGKCTLRLIALVSPLAMHEWPPPHCLCRRLRSRDAFQRIIAKFKWDALRQDSAGIIGAAIRYFDFHAKPAAVQAATNVGLCERCLGVQQLSLHLLCC